MSLSQKPGGTGNFEFESLRLAVNYRHALLREFRPHLTGEVIEVGAGVGQFTELIVQSGRARRVLAVEPDPAFCAELRQRFPEQVVLNGTARDLDSGTACDVIVSVNVLEHIEDDIGELDIYARLLKLRKGCLCLFVPARQEIYAPLDSDFGHFRRYSKKEVQEKLHRTGFDSIRLYYFNFVGYFAWWFNFCVLRKRAFSPRSVRFFDRCILPVGHTLESHVLRPPFGQSLLAVARVG